MLEPELAKEADANYDLLNPVVAKNIDYKTPEKGEVILRLINLAKERNIEYSKALSYESSTAVHEYCVRKHIPIPEGIGGPDGPVPTYAPMQPPPQPIDFSAMD